jgi:hypothetical protein
VKRSLSFFLAALLLQLITLPAIAPAQEEAQKPQKENQPKQQLPGKTQKQPKPDQAKLTPTPQVGQPQYDEKLFGGMRWRNVGPFRGGRVLAVTGVPGEPNVYYFGAVAGGVWKSTNGGRMWTPVFDQQNTSSIGSIAVSDSDHNVIYVGTGEACIRGNISYGDGVYKSLDGGQHWQHLGLKDRPRHLPHSRRRQELGESSLCRRQEWRHRRRLRSEESEHAFCIHLAGRSHSLFSEQRRPGQRHL